MTSFHKHFLHAVNQQALEDPEEIKLLVFAIMGIGTNVGLSKIAESLNDISYITGCKEITLNFVEFEGGGSNGSLIDCCCQTKTERSYHDEIVQHKQSRAFLRQTLKIFDSIVV
jgi:hypothetical protein